MATLFILCLERFTYSQMQVQEKKINYYFFRSVRVVAPLEVVTDFSS